MKFSIIIPTHNRQETLKKVLTNIVKLTYNPKFFEVLVVDNDSNDNTRVIVKNFIAAYPKIRIRYVFEKKIGPSFSRNTGIKKALYPYVICLDDDVLVDKNLLNRYSQSFKKHPTTSMIGGQNIPICKNKTKLQKLTSLLGENSWVFSDTKAMQVKPGLINYPNTLISANICINTNITGKIFFDTNFGRKYGQFMIFSEDSELCLRLLTDNKNIYFDESIKSKHIISEARLNYKYIFKRFLTAGMEQQLLVNKYGKGSGELYRPGLKTLYYLSVAYIKDICSRRLLLLLKEIVFIFGYYFPLKLLKYNN